jgi:hypothetical protein
MNRMLRGLVLLLVLASTAAAAAVEVVIVACQGPGPLLVVTESSSSAGAPAVPKGGSCSQAVADLLSARFKLVGVSSPGVGVIYTFERM